MSHEAISLASCYPIRKSALRYAIAHICGARRTGSKLPIAWVLFALTQRELSCFASKHRLFCPGILYWIPGQFYVMPIALFAEESTLDLLLQKLSYCLVHALIIGEKDGHAIDGLFLKIAIGRHSHLLKCRIL